jgi:hypothetical protein
MAYVIETSIACDANEDDCLIVFRGTIDDSADKSRARFLAKRAKWNMTRSGHFCPNCARDMFKRECRS